MSDVPQQKEDWFCRFVLRGPLIYFLPFLGAALVLAIKRAWPPVP